MSKSSRTSLRSYGKYGTRKKKEEHHGLLKPYNFCCNINESDNETRYDQHKPPFTSSLMVLSPIQESPMLKFRLQSIEPIIKVKQKGIKNKAKPKDWNLDGDQCVKTRGPLLSFQEDEIEIAKHYFWAEKQKMYNTEADRNALIGEKKVKKKMAATINPTGPRWYQDLSIPQIKQVLAFGETITADYEDAITLRTQNALAVIGVTSSSFKIDPHVIKKLQHNTKLDPVQFLREIYRRATGQYFEEEEYKKSYDCNERIILSAIAFLALPDAIIELNNRLPQISKTVFPPKPKPPQTVSTRHGIYESPYKEPLFSPPDWVMYKKSLDEWHEKCELVPRPRVVLPNLKNTRINHRQHFEDKTGMPDRRIMEHSATNLSDTQRLKEGQKLETKMIQNDNNGEWFETPFDQSALTLSGGDKQTFKFSISGLTEKSRPVNYKICGTLKPTFSKKKSWLGDKDAHYIISGISEHEDPPKCPVTYEMTGIACVTPNNSDEKFFAELKLGNGPKRVYPAGRKNLSKNWQEWLQDADEEFLEVEKEANKLIKSIEATMRLVIPGDRCDACCSCRQTRKANLKAHATKTPYMVIDSIAESDNQNRYIVGSLAMHSPAPSPVESTVNLLEVVASKETVQKKLVINGVTNNTGETIYYISGVVEDAQNTPKSTVFKEHPPKPLRNVPPCACRIEQIFNEGNISNLSCDDIPQTKKKGRCYGCKYRPKESPAFTCKEYPDDKSCRRNPLSNTLKRGIFLKSNSHIDDERDGTPKEKKLFTLSAFNPCGDDDGMAVCGGPWGARNPSLKISKPSEEHDEEKSEEEAEEEKGGKKKLSSKALAKIAKEGEAIKKKLKRERLKRDKLCSERFEDRFNDASKSLTMEEPPLYCDSDNPWDKMRTAPTVNPWEKEYEKSLKLTQVVLNSDNRKVINKEIFNNAASSTKQKRKNDENCNINIDEDKIRNNIRGNGKTAKDDVQVIYKGKEATRGSDGTSSQQLTARSVKLTAKHVEKSLLNPDMKLKKSVIETLKNHKMAKPKRIGVRIEDKKLEAAKKLVNKAKPNHKFERGYGKQNKSLIKNNSAHNRDKESLKKSTHLRKLRRNELNDTTHNRSKAKARSLLSFQQIDTTSNADEKFKEYKVSPVVISDEPHLPCQRENMYSDNESDNCGCSNEDDISTDGYNYGQSLKFGWRTKSQQELPREKTLVYLAEPNDPIEMVKLREGGRPCTCRENRNNKKILVYNIGGAIDVGRTARGIKPSQLIEGVTYLTPPQSPRNSSEYIPEYDLLESPHKMCERKRSDMNFKYISKLSTIRSRLPVRKNNVDSCPCGYDPQENGNEKYSPKIPSTSKANEWSTALKDEGLVDYFVSCQDMVPCWLRCAKFSKAGCCEKPKLLQVKKPVCECRYERRVVRREEEKQKWADRQRRFKFAKKQPYLQVAETSRPMMQDTKLIISSVKKVLRDDKFIPETQYCVTGIAENYAMGPPQFVTPGISMQSPVVTPQQSKPDILCMCGHRHWSPTDITPGNITENTSVRAKGEYPCRGREQNNEIAENLVLNEGETIGADNNEYYEAYQSYTGVESSCNKGFDKSMQLGGGKVRKLIRGDENVIGSANENLEKLKFNTAKVPRNLCTNGKNRNTERRDRKEVNKLRQTMAMGIEKPKTLRQQKQNYDFKISSLRNRRTKSKPTVGNDSSENTSSLENKSDLFGLMKIELEKMVNEDFILAKLPECWLIPQLRSWIEYREGKVYNDSMKKRLCDLSIKRWGMMKETRMPSVPLPSLNLTLAEAAGMTFNRANEMKEKIAAVQAKYFSGIRKMRVSQARWYWPTMEFGRFPNLSFKDAYFTYLAGKETDGHVFRPWKIEDSK